MNNTLLKLEDAFLFLQAMKYKRENKQYSTQITQLMDFSIVLSGIISAQEKMPSLNHSFNAGLKLQVEEFLSIFDELKRELNDK
jgi:hypothetical protein